MLPPHTVSRLLHFRANLHRISVLAWPVLVGQVAVLAFSTIDTLLLARHSPHDLAALAVGSAAYITVFVGLMGILLAIGPIVGALYGAGRHQEAGRQFHQGIWLALTLSALGIAVLAFPAPFVAMAKAGPELAQGIRGYMAAIAFALPAALLFTVYRGFNTAISRPKAVMTLQVGALLLKIPLSAALVWGLPSWGVESMGVTGCGVATAIVMWLQCGVAAWVMRRDDSYARFELSGRGLDAPNFVMLKEQLRLGVPMGLGILIEVTGFTFMAIFIARLGTLPVAGHQIAANLAALLFMMPLAISNATSTLVAQRLGAQDLLDARRLGWHGLWAGTALALSAAVALFVLRGPVVSLYTHDAQVAQAALPLVAWLLLFHVADALQTIAALVLRAYRIATVPVVIYAVSLWGVGLGGGHYLAFADHGLAPEWAQGAQAFWLAATAALGLSAVALVSLMAWVTREAAQSPLDAEAGSA